MHMTLQQAKDQFLNKVCDVNWDPIDRPARKNEAIPVDTVGVTVLHIYENCYGEVLFEAVSDCSAVRKVCTPFSVKRLCNPRLP